MRARANRLEQKEERTGFPPLSVIQLADAFLWRIDVGEAKLPGTCRRTTTTRLDDQRAVDRTSMGSPARPIGFTTTEPWASWRRLRIDIGLRPSSTVMHGNIENHVESHHRCA